ncbi:MAG TPA: hypothetical protein VK191_02045 [Symbiobacteriaceae bacterium]|nr:hypothetical protein [Symbiobacteriaceae bacterium]
MAKLQPFWAGLLMGVGLSLALGAGLVQGARTKGITVMVERRWVEEAVAQEVERTIQRELPVLLRQVEQEAPSKVAGAVSQRLDQLTIDLGWGAVKLPEPLKKQVEGGVTEAVSAGLKAGLQAVPTDQIASRVAGGAPRIVDRLTDVLGAQRLQVKVAGLSLPLRIHAQ